MIGQARFRDRVHGQGVPLARSYKPIQKVYASKDDWLDQLTCVRCRPIRGRAGQTAGEGTLGLWLE
jgi:hypothetical protein